MRLVHIGHIAFTYNAHDADDGPKAFRLLHEIQHLNRLDITIDKKEWLKEHPKLADVSQVPGLGVLRKLRGLRTVNFHGDCKNIERRLGPEMIQPNAKTKATTGAKGKGRKKRNAARGRKGFQAPDGSQRA